MSDWITSTLAQECSISIGGTPARNCPRYWDVDTQTSNYWVAISDLQGRYITSTAERISDEGVKHSSTKLVKRGSVLLSFKLTLGRTAIAGVDLYTNEAIAALHSETLDHLFLHYGLQSWDLLSDVDQAIKGATLNKAKLRKIPISFPKSREEQERIAEVLDTIDHSIEQTEALLAKQQRIKSGLMNDLLTRGLDAQGYVREHSTHQFKETVLGSVPEDWNEINLGTLATLVTSGPRGWACYYAKKGAKFIRIGNLTREHVNLRLDDMQFVEPPIGAEGNRTQLAPGDILLSITADLGIIGLIPSGFGGAYINQHIALIRPKFDDIISGWLANFLASHRIQKWISNINESGAKAGLNLPTIRAIPITAPKPPEQQRIADILAFCDEQIAQSHMLVLKLRRQKAGLMNDLLTGYVPVTPLLANPITLISL
jgi:type I restriction enzyme, S subunit